VIPGKMKTLVAGFGVILLLFLSWQNAFCYSNEDEKAFLTKIRESARTWFPDDFARLMQGYGLHQYPVEAESGKRDIVLIHGLDDPGLIWIDLAPTLADAGYRVWMMNYPNDQPVHESAVFFAEQLQKFAADNNISEVDIIAHSMGGLVTRDMLTSPDIGYTDLRHARKVPDVYRFIMVGTPNHGSYFARLRFLTEIRDQIVSASDGDYDWLQFIVDGVGEAGIDLYPNSVFLKGLNARPLPAVPRMLVIAGVLTSLDQKMISDSLTSLSSLLPGSAADFLEDARPFVESLAQDIGDGLVPVASARLAGVAMKEVAGSHLSIIRNLGFDSRRVPPAIPVIMREIANP